jgi:hypothetical protein
MPRIRLIKRKRSVKKMTQKEKIITKDVAYEIATKMIGKYLTAPYGKKLVSDWEDPLDAYIQDVGSRSMAGEVFSVKCPGISNIDSTFFTEDFVAWDEKHGAYIVDQEHMEDCGRIVGDLSDVILECVEDGDVTDAIDALANDIYLSANEDI